MSTVDFSTTNIVTVKFVYNFF